MEIEYKGFTITRDQVSKRIFHTSLSKDGVTIPRSYLITYEELEPSIFNKKQCGLSIRDYKLLIDKYLTKEGK
jgi:hypothetical protein